MARDLPLRPADVPPSMYGPDLQLELEDSAGDRYSVNLPYLATEDVRLPPAEEPLYPGFTTVMERLDFNVLLPDDGRNIVLLQWLDFEYELIQDVIDLMDFAAREGLLAHTLVIDVTDSSGNDAARKIRTVNVVDSAAPQITLLGANPVTLTLGTPYSEPGFTASDTGTGGVSIV